MRVPFGELARGIARALRAIGFAESRALLCARLFAETTRDGVYSHGLNRFPRFLEMIRNGSVDIHAAPEFVARKGVLERWDGHRGPGNLNAYASMERAIAVAREQGVGCVALSNTSHWMRAGSYGWQAAEAGVIGLCWTNTLPNLPPWGASDVRLGNNPMVVAVPRPNGHVVLDMAMSQFSYGALASYRERGEPLPVPGGYDAAGKLTCDAGAIEASQRLLPIGYWKGSGLALMLDLLATILSGGQATWQQSPDFARESGISQVFAAIDPFSFGTPEAFAAIADRIVESVQQGAAGGGERGRYPGERTLQLRAENSALGVPVNPGIWREVQAMGV